MNHFSKKIRFTILAISIWTVVQTIFHEFWIIYTYLMSICQIKPSYYDVVFVYLTYFYRQSCGPIELKSEAFFLNSTLPEQDFNFNNSTTSEVLYHFLTTVLNNGQLPERSSFASRTELYLFLFLYADVTWIFTSVCLVVGAYWDHKQKFLSILFYGPWMLVCIYVNFLDVVASVHYGLDMVYIHSYSSWLRFIGVSNYRDFEHFNKHPSSSFIPAMPSTIVVSLFSRVFLVWLVNVICFFIIFFLALPDICVRMTVRPSSKSKTSGRSKLRFDTGEELDLNSSEARIRNWQLFYGAVEANNTMTSSGRNSSLASNETDHNLNTKPGDGDDKNTKKQSKGFPEEATQDQQSPGSSTSGFRRYSDVASHVLGLSTVATIDTDTKMQILRGQLPWSYISPDGQYVRRNPTYTKKTILKNIQIRDSITGSSRL